MEDAMMIQKGDFKRVCFIRYYYEPASVEQVVVWLLVDKVCTNVNALIILISIIIKWQIDDLYVLHVCIRSYAML